LDKEYDKIMKMLEDLARKYEELSKRVKELEREIKGEGRFEEAEERYMEERKTPVYRRSISSRTRVPREPISKWASFPRRLTSEEIDVFWRVFANKLMEYGLNPEDDFCIDHWRNFRDACHKSWEQIIERFNQTIEDILAGREPRIFPPPEIEFKDIPRELVIHFAALDSGRPVDEQAKTIEELTEYIKEEAKDLVPLEKRGKIEGLTSKDVRKILEEEYAKGEKCHMRFKPLLEKKNYLWNILRLKDLEEEAKWSTLAGLWEGTKSLRDLVDYVRTVHGYRVTEDDVKRWIREELEKPPEKAHTKIRLYRWKAEEIIK
jgi:hypothetical protein